MGHRKGNELLPVLRAGEPPSGFQLFVQGRPRQWGHQAKDRQPRRPSANFPQSSLRHARRVIVHAKDKRGDGKNIAPGQPVEHHSIFTWLVEAFFYVSKVGRIDGFHPDEDPLAARGRDQINEFLIAQQIGADLGDPMHLGVSRNDVSQQRFCALYVNGKIVVDEKYGNLAALLPRARFQEQEFVHHAFIGTKADGVAKKSRYSAKLASVGTAAPGLHGNNSKGSPTAAHSLEQWVQYAGEQIELLQLDFVPGNLRIGLQGWFALLAKVVHWRVDVLERAAHGIFHNSGPCLIRFAKSNRVGMARAAVTPESLIGHFRDVRAAHYDLYSRGAHCVRHAIGLSDHPGHRTYADQAHILFTHVSRNTLLIHGLRVAVNQHHFVARRS